jgi:hypothetical protein
MIGLVQVLAGMLIVAGAVGLFAPRAIVAFGRRFLSRGGLAFGFLTRALFAVALWIAASEAATPGTFQVLAVIFAASAVGLLFMGAERLERVLDRAGGTKNSVLRLLYLTTIALGAFIMWSATA